MSQKLAENTGGIEAVIAVLGPDMTSEEWAIRLGVPRSVIEAAARHWGVRLKRDTAREAIADALKAMALGDYKSARTILRAEIVGMRR